MLEKTNAGDIDRLEAQADLIAEDTTWESKRDSIFRVQAEDFVELGIEEFPY